MALPPEEAAERRARWQKRWGEKPQNPETMEEKLRYYRALIALNPHADAIGIGRPFGETAMLGHAVIAVKCHRR